MSIFSKVFGGDAKTADSIISNGKEIIDGLHFSKEEKSAASLKAFELWTKFMEATSGQNLARRYIAMIVFGLWSLLTVVLVLMAILASIFAYENPPHEPIIEILMEMRVTEITLMIAAFYFGKHLITSAIGAAKK